jgi:hypothetical protein
MSSELVIENYEFQYLDLNSIKETVFLEQTFEKFGENCLNFNETKNLKFHLNYSPRHRISVIDLIFRDILTENPEQIQLEVNLFINSYRYCIIDKQIKGNKNFWRFICEYNSLEDYQNDTIIPQSLNFSFKSEKIFSLSICEILVYKFQDDCGKPDEPLHSSIRYNGKRVVYFSTQKRRYRLIGHNITNCVEGNWDKEAPVLELIQCSVDQIDLSSSVYKSIKLRNFELIDENKGAVVNSRIEFQCNYGENSSKILSAICDESGLWIGDDYKCG